MVKIANPKTTWNTVIIIQNRALRIIMNTYFNCIPGPSEFLRKKDTTDPYRVLKRIIEHNVMTTQLLNRCFGWSELE